VTESIISAHLAISNVLCVMTLASCGRWVWSAGDYQSGATAIADRVAGALQHATAGKFLEENRV